MKKSFLTLSGSILVIFLCTMCQVSNDNDMSQAATKGLGEVSITEPEPDNIPAEDAVTRQVTPTNITAGVSSLSIIAVTHGDTDANSDSPIYMDLYTTTGPKMVIRLDSSRNDFEKNRADRFEYTCPYTFQIEDLTDFRLRINGTDAWHCKGIIIIVNKTTPVYCKMNMGIWFDKDGFLAPAKSGSYVTHIPHLILEKFV
ncbi:MAG: hypothetical protein JW969_10485 [Spirochaetales bacterium]|nr:hypothetical protein [Spirochaetales bacterium]